MEEKFGASGRHIRNERGGRTFRKFAVIKDFLDVISGYRKFLTLLCALCDSLRGRLSTGQALDDTTDSVICPDSVSAWRREWTMRGGVRNLAGDLIGVLCGKNLAQSRRARRGRNESSERTFGKFAVIKRASVKLGVLAIAVCCRIGLRWVGT